MAVDTTLEGYLLERGRVSAEALAEASRLAQAERLRLDQALVHLGHVDERDMLHALGAQLGISVVELADAEPDPDALRALPVKFVYRKRMVPVERDNGTLRVATSDPYDLYAFDELRMVTGLHVEPVLAAQHEIEALIKRHYGLGGDTLDEMTQDNELQVVSDVNDESQDLVEMAQEASVIKLVNEIIVEAVNERASDIHIEPYEDRLSIRYRIDGVLQEASVPPQIHRFQAAIISRLKILANLNIAEKRLPQDGRIKFQVSGHTIDVRVSVIPMLFGEGVVLRLLDQSNIMFSLPELGMDEQTHRAFGELIRRPHGILLVTGPTGSGKSTTLYASLRAIMGPEKKVITIEDPVEYHVHGVNQIPVETKVGMSFARGLRAVLRHDPDVVMIGEIRDLETAQAATQAALTGHLVLSTLHTNDAASAATRLIDMGVEPFLVASTLIGAMAQRLVRRVCPECKQAYEPEAGLLPPDVHIAPGHKLHKGAGCRNCRNTGYRGRQGLYELMPMDDNVAERILARTGSSEVAAAARAGGMRLLREDGWDKVLAGVTTPEEVMRCTA